MRRYILRNSFWGNLNVLFRYVLSFVAVTIIASKYGPREFGLYQLALTYIAIVDGINFLNPAYVRNYLASHKTDEKLVIGSWVLNSLIVILLSILCFGYIWFQAEEKSFLVIMALCGSRLVFRIFDYSQILIDSRLRADLVQKIQISSNAMFNMSRIVFALLGTSINSVSASSVLQGLTSAAHGLHLSKNIGIPVWGEFNSSFFWKIVRASFGLTVATFLSIFQLRIFGVLLSNKMSLDDYGSAQLVLKLMEPITAIGTIIIGANYTILAKSFQDNKKLFKIRFGKVSLLTLISSLFLSLTVFIVPLDFLINIFGTQYEAGLSCLWISPILVVANVVFSIMIQFYTLTHQYKTTVMKYVLAIVAYFIIYISMSEISILDGLLISAIVPLSISILFVLKSWLFKDPKIVEGN